MRHNQRIWRSSGTDNGLSGVLLGLARDVREAIQDGPTDPEEIAGLNLRILQLRDALNSRSDTPLSRWFENLQRQLGPAACESNVH